MNPARHEGLRLIAHGLQFYGSATAAEFITRLTGFLSEKEAWEVIAEAERIGMIEHAEMVVKATTPRGQMWRLVEGFDTKQLEISA